VNITAQLQPSLWHLGHRTRHQQQNQVWLAELRITGVINPDLEHLANHKEVDLSIITNLQAEIKQLQQQLLELGWAEENYEDNISELQVAQVEISR
jgi:hypothetical protein